MLDAGEVGGDDDHAARGGARAELAERRGVDAHPVGAEPVVGEARLAVALDFGVDRQHAPAERAGAGDDPPGAVDDLHQAPARARPSR